MTFRTVALAALLASASAAQAQLNVLPGSVKNFVGYDGQPAAQTGVLSSGIQGFLAASGPGTVSFTYLGQESANANQFTFSVGSQTLTEANAVGTTIQGSVVSAINFSFQDISTGGSFSNGSASIVYVPNVATTSFGSFDYVIGFNDNGSPDGDFDDFVVGARFTPAVPEPETYALMFAGLGVVGFMARRRRA